ncbi:MAG: protein-glutamate O-methyltransferase CheR [Gemmatimonadetes bacterium]|nr:protein-glutamate O-methyltransferase CheR [Gemmatimonadota bacterium]
MIEPTTAHLPALPALALSEAQFRRVSELVTGTAGIQLRPGKENLVRARLAKRLRALALPTVQDYLDIVDRDATGRELAELVDVLTTNKTAFFREPDHFRLLQQTVLPSLARTGAPIRIWSAGCSSGQEAYSIAMVVRETLGPAASRVSILATDISQRVLQRAHAAEYLVRELGDMPTDVRRAHFDTVPDARDTVRIAPATRALVRIAPLNLIAEWPEQGPFDVIFCRNVMIYFDKPTQERLVSRFAAQLSAGGHLMLGHSESLSGVRHGLAYVQPATYQRTAPLPSVPGNRLDASMITL